MHACGDNNRVLQNHRSGPVTSENGGLPIAGPLLFRYINADNEPCKRSDDAVSRATTKAHNCAEACSAHSAFEAWQPFVTAGGGGHCLSLHVRALRLPCGAQGAPQWSFHWQFRVASAAQPLRWRWRRLRGGIVAACSLVEQVEQGVVGMMMTIRQLGGGCVIMRHRYRGQHRVAVRVCCCGCGWPPARPCMLRPRQCSQKRRAYCAVSCAAPAAPLPHIIFDVVGGCLRAVVPQQALCNNPSPRPRLAGCPGMHACRPGRGYCSSIG